MITLRVNGKDYTNFKSISVKRDIENLVGYMMFTASTSVDEVFPILVNHYFEVIVDGIRYLNGYIETLDVKYDSESHDVNCTGRGILMDLVDSNLSATKTFPGPYDFYNICRKVLDEIGLTYVRIINNVKDLEPFSKDELEIINFYLYGRIDEDGNIKSLVHESTGEVVIIDNAEDLWNVLQDIKKK
jgi:prophage tail gpP-like protein